MIWNVRTLGLVPRNQEASPDLYLLLLHSLIAGAARRVVDRDGPKLAGMAVPIPPRSGLLHPGPPERLLDLAIVLLQHLVSDDAWRTGQGPGMVDLVSLGSTALLPKMTTGQSALLQLLSK
jgi:hypothetical protein